MAVAKCAIALQKALRRLESCARTPFTTWQVVESIAYIEREVVIVIRIIICYVYKIPKIKSLHDIIACCTEKIASQNVMKHEVPLKIEIITYTAAKQGQHLFTVTYILK